MRGSARAWASAPWPCSPWRGSSSPTRPTDESAVSAMGRSEAAPGELITHQVRLGLRTVDYQLRRSARSRGLRVTIDGRDGLVVSVPPATRRGWARPEPRIEAFLRERQTWVLRHVDRLARERD